MLFAIGSVVVKRSQGRCGLVHRVAQKYTSVKIAGLNYKRYGLGLHHLSVYPQRSQILSSEN